MHTHLASAGLDAYETTIVIGPATVIASVRTPVAGALLARETYVNPANPSGIVHPPAAKAVKAVPPVCPPLVNAQNVPVVAALTSLICCPAATVACAPGAMVRAENGVMARLEPLGQDVMKPAASVKTERIPRGVSKAEGMAAALEAVRMKVWWRASTVTISAATVRTAGEVRRGAAPRYAETPMFSRTLAVETMAAASVKPKLYVHGWTGAAPVAAMAESSVVTWTCSVVPIDCRLVMSSAVRPAAVKSAAGNLAKPCV